MAGFTFASGNCESDEQFEARLPISSNSFSAHDSSLFGEKIDLYTGRVSFHQTDLVIKGNGPDIVISRTLKDQGQSLYPKRLTNSLMLDWSLDIPSIHTTLYKKPKQKGDNYKDHMRLLYGSWGMGKACSGNINPTGLTKIPKKADDPAISWSGDFLSIAGQDMLLLETPAKDGKFRRKTTSNWRFSCNTKLTNSNDEGFVGYSPDGTKYTFNKLSVSRYNKGSKLGAFEAHILVTKVEDRFGNSLQYHYENIQLIKITASDGREVTFEYGKLHPNHSNTQLKAIHHGDKTWQYEYAGGRLSKVILPDNNHWGFQHSSNNRRNLSTRIDGTFNTGGKTDITMHHPDGAKGVFKFKVQNFGRSNTRSIARTAYDYKKKKNYTIKFRWPDNPVLALESKTITYAKDKSMIWRYSHSQTKGSWFTTKPNDSNNLKEDLPSNIIDNTSEYGLVHFGFPLIGKAHHKWVKEIRPDGSFVKYYFNRNGVSSLEGQLMATRTYDKGGLIEEVQYDYTTSPVGNSGLLLDNLFNKNVRISQTKKVIDLAGDTYTTEYSQFNPYGAVQHIHEYNNVSHNERYIKLSYQHNLDKWVLNLPRLEYVSLDNQFNTATKETTYHKDSLLPHQSKEMGSLVKTNTYHKDGQLKKIDYHGSQRYELYESYFRGIPRKITLPCSLANGCSTANGSSKNTVVTKVDVNSDATVKSITDFKGHKTNYEYNAMGWLTKENYNNKAIENKEISYTKVNSDGDDGGYSGLVSKGFTKRTLKQGDYEQVSYFDFMLRPVLEIERDIKKNNTTYYKRKGYDHEGRITFESFPHHVLHHKARLRTQYDALGRILDVTRESDGGTTNYEYLKGNRVRIIDAKGNTTTNSYLAYGMPSHDLAVEIDGPEHSLTQINYNLFGHITQIAQGGKQEKRIYDTRQRLCKIVRPETGITAVGFNNQNQPVWRAEGTKGSSKICDAKVVPESHKIKFQYDQLGHLKAEIYPDNTPNKSYRYDENNNLTQLNAGSIKWQYQYNGLDQLSSEALTIGAKKLSIKREYDKLGHLSSLTYPTGTKMAFAPNAHGQPTTAGNLITKAIYYGNGQLRSARFENGLSYGTVLDTSQRINKLQHLSKDSKALALTFTYDNNDNVTAINDLVNTKYSVKQIGYDGLDRLTRAKGKWGAGSYHYDSLGNFTSRSVSGGKIDYQYDNKNHLTQVTGAYKYQYSYDARGNITKNGRYALSYNKANQLVSANGQTSIYDGYNRQVKSSNKAGSRFSLYDVNGQLLYREDEKGLKTEYIYLGNKLIAEKRDQTIIYQHTDHLGTPLAQSDAKGKVTTRNYYEPFGKRLSGDKAGIGYTGHLHDKELGLTYMQARYYDPLIGRFYSNDPVGFAGGSHSFNRYAYANNNPYKYVDPNGEWAVQAAGFATGFVIGAGLDIYNSQDFNLMNTVQAGVIGGTVGLASTFGGGWLGTMAMGGTANGLGELANQALKGEFAPYNVAEAFILGTFGGALGKGGAQALIKRRGFPNNTLTQSQHNMTPSTTSRILQNSYSPAYTDAKRSVAEVQIGAGYGGAAGFASSATNGFNGGAETIVDYVSQLPEW
ncbi:RHS repeat-associated core domain-containing protein [Shewanella surugensis]|uniref:Teneurin-like YD-shell domain-containing protein n=1 Tax=Shewanella surugensis TaxID=212020 RepID=A0ABT0LI81_9GAMM|nr:RHS repeat-associated core domain-containing protein [Shewanella surugensis]MCL1127391.1 hypothetical protein [Shewanella surugensis]